MCEKRSIYMKRILPLPYMIRDLYRYTERDLYVLKKNRRCRHGLLVEPVKEIYAPNSSLNSFYISRRSLMGGFG